MIVTLNILVIINNCYERKLMRGVAKNFAHLPSSEVVSKSCKMALINYTKCNKKEQKQV